MENSSLMKLIYKLKITFRFSPFDNILFSEHRITLRNAVYSLIIKQIIISSVFFFYWKYHINSLSHVSKISLRNTIFLTTSHPSVIRSIDSPSLYNKHLKFPASVCIPEIKARNMCHQMFTFILKNMFQTRKYIWRSCM